MTQSTPTPVLEIGGTHVTSALVDLCGGHVLAGSAHREQLSGDAPAEEIIGTIAQCARQLNVTAAAHWGVAVPGPFDYARGIALFEKVGKFDSLRGMDVGAALCRALPGMMGSLTFLNDADAFGLGEYINGAASGCDRAAAITLGTGVGSCFIAGARIVENDPSVPPEGRADLLTWEGHPLEDIVSRRGIRASYAARRGLPVQNVDDVRTIAAAARRGDTTAGEVLNDAFVVLGKVLSPWLARFGASALVVGGSMAASWDIVEPPLRLGLRGGEKALAGLKVLPAAQPEDAALFGAAWYAHHGVPDRGAAADPLRSARHRLDSRRGKYS